ncbi:MAG: threonine synthase [Gammaproteobacteria bacterium]|nr:threonine synthase [Gammaproteobacteria bacterium]MDH5629073.1 threonine synthase [Gammaproteobacteria bacterium]
MKFYNLNDNNQQVDFKTAVQTGLGRNQGLFFPKKLPTLENVDELLEQDFITRSHAILSPYVNENINNDTLTTIIAESFNFPILLNSVSQNKDCNQFCLELFHGPTLAFKDFGARFMAQCLSYFSSDQKITILTATSGDTGAAVAHAFYGLENIEVVILFPKGKISPLQQKMFTTLDKNIRTIAIDGSFDDCQQLVKQSFDDQELVKDVGLNSANSINISRLLAQVCYYFEAVSQLPKSHRNNLAISVPCGNFGNLCAATIAKTMGLPVEKLIAATNENDTVPRYLDTGKWQPNPTVATLSNAMDVSKPNNWPRIEYLIQSEQISTELIQAIKIDELTTKQGMAELNNINYLTEPHGAVAYQALKALTQKQMNGIFLGTAHPAKFKESVESILSLSLDLPEAIQNCADKTDLSVDLAADYKSLKAFLQNL